MSCIRKSLMPALLQDVANDFFTSPILCSRQFGASVLSIFYSQAPTESQTLRKSPIVLYLRNVNPSPNTNPMPNEIKLFETGGPFSVTLLLINLLVGLALAFLICWHFRRFGSTVSNREELGQVIPFVLLTVVLIISVVKSSLALSLGLVGALSIVRFRTPIKEPEELAYLFIAIAVGLALGANQTTAAIIACIFILTVLAVFKKVRSPRFGKSVYLSVDMAIDNVDSTKWAKEINDVIAGASKRADLRRLDIHDKQMEATYYINLESVAELSILTSELQRKFPAIGITYLDQTQLPSI